MPAALLELSPIVLLIIALGLAIVATKLIHALFGPLVSALQTIPVIGNSLASPFEAIAASLTRFLGSVEDGIDRLIGAMFHILAAQFEWLWREIKSHAALLGLVSPLLAAAVYAIEHLRALVHSAHSVASSVGHAVKTLEKEFHGIEHRVKVLEREIGAGIGNDVRTSIDHLLKWEKAAQAELAADAKAIAQTIPAEIGALRDFLGIKSGSDYLSWAAGIVTAALGLSIFNWFRCDNARNMANNRGCSAWGALDDLLGLLALGIAAENFDTLVHEAQDLTEGAVTVFDDIFGIQR